jgi:MFS transporter, putative metabolite:H+ symporter
MTKQAHTNPFNIVVIVAALGYFVDVYDLIIFGIVKDSSLMAIGITGAAQIKAAGVYLLNLQLIGLILGGIVWGILGDKKGRMSTLFLTILLYSLANIANGFVQNIDQYAILRFIAGFGLAGELGVSITLVSEVMTKETRAYGSGLVSFIGIMGAALAFYVSEFGWKQAYWFGGTLGLLLLALRVYVHESGMFDKLKISEVKRGNFMSLFTSKQRFFKYISCILIGLPTWFTIGILVFFAKDFAIKLGITEPVTNGRAILYHYIGASIGSMVISIISQKLKSRKKAILIALTALSSFSAWYFMSDGVSANRFYFIIFVLGIAMGYWSIFVTVASEQFGTNIRSTVTTSVPNFVRGSAVLMLLAWQHLEPQMGIINSAITVGSVALSLALIGVFYIEESYGKDIDYVEAD